MKEKKRLWTKRNRLKDNQYLNLLTKLCFTNFSSIYSFHSDNDSFTANEPLFPKGNLDHLTGARMVYSKRNETIIMAPTKVNPGLVHNMRFDLSVLFMGSTSSDEG